MYSLWRILARCKGGSSRHPPPQRGLSFRGSGHKGLAPVAMGSCKELPQRVIWHHVWTFG